MKKEKSDDLVLLMFQTTVAERHPTLGKLGTTLLDSVSSLYSGFDPAKNEVYFVFVVETPFEQAETFKTMGDKDKTKALKHSAHTKKLVRIKQICLELGKS